MKHDEDDDTQVYADTLLIVYQRGFADGKKAALAQEQALKKLARLGQEIEQQAEPVAMRMPKVGDKVICLEDESLGTVESLTAGGSPDIVFDDGSHGTYMLREFAELFGYVAAQWDKPSASFNEWWDSYRHDPANPFAEGSAAYWAWAGWMAAQRQWVGLTNEQLDDIAVVARRGNLHDLRIAIEAKLKERNT